MSEKIELIEAKDLPMTEEEDVTVLCVGADGEMKRRDAGSFGMKMSELAELPTTEAEEVYVICVDAEGNLRRKSSASLGGGDKADLVIRADRYPDHNSSIANFEIISGSIEEVFDIFESGGFPTAEVEIQVPRNVTEYIHPAFRVSGYLQFYGGTLYIQFLCPGRPNSPANSTMLMCRMICRSTGEISWMSQSFKSFSDWDT